MSLILGDFVAALHHGREGQRESKAGAEGAESYLRVELSIPSPHAAGRKRNNRRSCGK